jgi:transcription elongation GreA/GreB family factor
VQTVDKKALVERLREALRHDLDAATRAAKDAAQAATHEENKPENDKDMRSTEASYLARGQADRVHELERCLDALKALGFRAWKEGESIAIGALVIVGHEGARAAYFLAPGGGGMRATSEGLEVQVVTPHSPLGRALVGRAAGDAVQVSGPAGVRELEIVEVQ